MIKFSFPVSGSGLHGVALQAPGHTTAIMYANSQNAQPQPGGPQQPRVRQMQINGQHPQYFTPGHPSQQGAAVIHGNAQPRQPPVLTQAQIPVSTKSQ